jgi:hypothetical protein
MVLIGDFEGLDSQRGIAWRCADSLGLRTFLGIAITEDTPVHASMTIIRQRLPEPVCDKVFVFVLSLLEKPGLLRGKSVALDATTLEANAAMKSIVRKDTGEGWKQYLQGLAQAEGIEHPTEEDLRRLDRVRKDKKVSNEQWKSPTDPDSRIAKMKDGRTHLAYKAEHAVDVASEAIVATTVTFADRSDPHSAPVTLSLAEANLALAGSETEIKEAVMDKCAAYNLGLLLRKVWGFCKPRNAEAAGAAFFFVLSPLLVMAAIVTSHATNRVWVWLIGMPGLLLVSLGANRTVRSICACRKKSHSLTGC